jgi:thymidylate synthase
MLEREEVDCEPKIWINPKKRDFYEFTVDDVKIIDYPRDEIKAKNPQLKFDLGV